MPLCYVKLSFLFSHLNKVGKDGKKPMIEYAKVAKELNMLN